MSVIERTEEGLKEVARRVLSGWSLYRPADNVVVKLMPNGVWWIGYCSDFDGTPFTPQMDMAEDPPHFLHLNLSGDQLFILYLQIREAKRGLGHGAELYALCEKLAFELGCKRITQTASGGYGEQSREEYLIKHGWKSKGNCVVYKEPSSTERNHDKGFRQSRRR